MIRKLIGSVILLALVTTPPGHHALDAAGRIAGFIYTEFVIHPILDGVNE